MKITQINGAAGQSSSRHSYEEGLTESEARAEAESLVRALPVPATVIAYDDGVAMFGYRADGSGVSPVPAEVIDRKNMWAAAGRSDCAAPAPDPAEPASPPPSVGSF